MKTENFGEYTVRLSTEPSFYGDSCTRADATQIVERLGTMLQSEFPGVQTSTYVDGCGSSTTSGPDEDVIERINQWIDTHWTEAL